MRIRPMGLGGALCVLGDGISPEISGAVARLDAALKESAPQWLIETVPAYASLLVRFDPRTISCGRVNRALRAAERRSRARTGAEGPQARTIEIPVCYGGEYGPDLAFVAEHAGLSEEDAVRLHSERAYHIYMLGFLPGFCYLGGLDEKLETPRLASPRARIPAGSVGIGGKQTGIYPLDSPGGWQLIGRTPLHLFDPSSPLPYRAGDSIRFRPITPAEYAAYEEAGHGH